MRIVTKPADTAIDPASDDDGGGTPPRARTLLALVLAVGGEPTVSASARPGFRGSRGASLSLPSLRIGVGGLLRDPRWGLAKRLSTAFELCASGKPHTPDPPTRTSGIGTVSDTLLWLLRGWPASTNLWPLCVPNIKPSKLRDMALSGPTHGVTRRGFLHRTHRGRLDAPGPPPRRSPARVVLPPPPMVAGRAIGPIRRPPPASLLRSVAMSGLVLGKSTKPHLRPLTLMRKVRGPCAQARPTRVGWLMRTSTAPPRRVSPRILAAGWNLTRPAGRYVAAGQASLSRRRLSIAPAVEARGKCLIRRRPLMTPSPRRLAGAGATLGHLATPRGRMGFCPTRRSTSVD